MLWSQHEFIMKLETLRFGLHGLSIRCLVTLHCKSCIYKLFINSKWFETHYDVVVGHFKC